jgi:hypothetical protein
MAAHISKEIPVGFAVFFLAVGEADNFPGVGREILGVLVCTDLLGFCPGQIIPLLARNLTPPTSGA